MVKVRNMVSPSSGNEVANQFIVTQNGVETFQSYDTTIAVRQVDGVVVLDNRAFDYSNTTSKYLKQFLYGNGRKDVERSVANGESKYVYADLN